MNGQAPCKERTESFCLLRSCTALFLFLREFCLHGKSWPSRAVNRWGKRLARVHISVGERDGQIIRLASLLRHKGKC